MIKAVCDGYVTKPCVGEVTHKHGQIPDRHFCKPCAARLNNVVASGLAVVIDAGAGLISYRTKLTEIRQHTMYALQCHAKIDPCASIQEDTDPDSLWAVWFTMLGSLSLIYDDATEALDRGALN